MQRLWRLLENEAERQRVALDGLRIYLGVALVVRGGLFIAEPRLVAQLVEEHGFFWPMVIAHVVALAHLGGGLLLALGLETRVAAAVQVPALVGALVFIHLREGLFSSGQGLELSALVLVMLGAIMLAGGGPFSLDAWMASREPTAEEVLKKLDPVVDAANLRNSR